MLLPVIMVGGTGGHLQLVSRELYPKQFPRLFGQNPMLQETITRLSDLGVHEPMIICNEKHRFLVAEQLRQLNKLSDNIILEPVGRNTAPAIALAALQTARHGDDSLILVLVADHIINNQPVFHNAIRVAEQYADEGHLITFGIVSNTPETGYGYIQRGVTLTDSAHTPYQVARFVEKPDHECTEAYLTSGEYCWNSGMFVFHAKKYLSELTKFHPDILKTYQAAVNAADNDSDFISVPHDIFYECPGESVDHAVMRRTADTVVIGLDTDWDDVDSWSALWRINPKDEQGNVLSSDAQVHDSENCYISSDGKLVAAIGVGNLVIVSTKNVVLVMNRKRSQDMKKAVEFLKQNQRSEYKRYREIYRPWGRCDMVAQTPRFGVNRITVKPGGTFPMQMHHHRAEHRVILAGTGQVTVNGRQFLLTENQSISIPINAEHSLENPGRTPLEVLEIQSGSYLGEDNIIRIRDQYGRCQFFSERNTE